MKKIPLLLVYIAPWSVANGQTILSWKEEPLLGKVKVIEQSGYDIPSLQDRSFQIKSKFIAHYDSTGRLLDKVYYSAKGELNKTTVIDYDSIGNIVQISTGSKSNPAAKKTTFLYNGKANITETREYEQNEIVYPTVKYSYNLNNQLIEERNYYPDDEPGAIDSFFYNAEGKLSTRKTISTAGTVMTFNYYYNDKGYISTLDRINKDGNLEARTKYTYDKYDSMGNWTKKMGYKNENVFSEMSRKIIYYK